MERKCAGWRMSLGILVGWLAGVWIGGVGGGCGDRERREAGVASCRVSRECSRTFGT